MRYLEQPLAPAKLLDDENPFKLAIFAANCKGGTTMTSAEGIIEVTWPETVHIATEGDRLGFDGIISIARWKGFGGVTNHNDRSFETITWAAGIAAITKNIQVVATVQVPTIHPVRLAKSAVTIDHISGGRFGLNVVAGWHDDEVRMFGSSVGDHAERYRISDEWLTAVKRLWSEDEFDFEGRYFTIPGAHSEPKPMRRPLLMSAGSSPTGRDFAARHTDINFAFIQNPADTAATVSDIKRRAREQHGRDIKVMAMAIVVCEDTQQQARDVLNYAVYEKGDWDTVRSYLQIAARHGKSGEYLAEDLPARYIAGYGAHQLVGTPEQIVSGFKELADAGLDGVTLVWFDYAKGLRDYEKKLLPLMREAGLRA